MTHAFLRRSGELWCGHCGKDHDDPVHDVNNPRDRARRKVLAQCKTFGLTDGDRYDLATVLLDRNVGSFNDLSLVELGRLTDALNGAAYVMHLLLDRRRLVRIDAAVPR